MNINDFKTEKIDYKKTLEDVEKFMNDRINSGLITYAAKKELEWFRGYIHEALMWNEVTTSMSLQQ